MTYASMCECVDDCRRRNGNDRTVAILRRFGSNQLREIAVSHYDALVKALARS